jgi:MFS family permease
MKQTLSSIARAVGWWETLATPGPPRLLALNALTGSFGNGLAAVCLPIFAVRVTGVSAERLVTILSVTAVCALLAAVPNGALAGRFGVGRFIVSTKIVQSLLWAAIAFVHGAWPLLVLSALTGLAGGGSGGLAQSVTVATLPGGARAEVLGSVRALRNVGYMVSGSIGSLVLTLGTPWSLRAAMLANAVSYACGAAWMKPLGRGVVKATRKGTDWGVLRDIPYLALIGCAAVFGSSLVVLDVGLSLWVLRHDQIPRALVGAALVVNTVLVVVLQHRYSARSAKLPQALRSLRRSIVAFAAMALLIACTAHASALAATVLMAAASVALTFGELYESPAWWTVSYELAPADRRDEYLSAFDISSSVVGIAGPVALAGVVALGGLGWVLYAAVFALAGTVALALVARRTSYRGRPAGAPAPAPEGPAAG